MINLADNLKMVELYCINQGDKFRPFSVNILNIIEASDTEEVKAEKVEQVCAEMDEKFAFHTNRLRTYLNDDPEDF